ncbi:hypothetical protein B0I35DRAFT_267483 [Stachybotrys elegans]|uniref:RING-type domain-containing protein n=1 Tax=Stachybotrys elegans TaxID=80388 RepID=A0A8K0SQP8_9HYPO|nr:hypothetical protein B0I35DRAFT_267483 [Stachybotrys elegans]
MAAHQGQGHQAYDLLIILDGTGSMSSYVRGLNRSLPQILGMAALTDCFQRIGVIAYRDYCVKNSRDIVEWSGWCSPSGTYTAPDLVPQHKVLEMAGRIRTMANLDWDEAAKTGLAFAHSKMRADATTIILFYTDAAPHFRSVGGPNCSEEIDILSSPNSYGGSGPLFLDWVQAAWTLKSGPKKAAVYSILSDGYTYNLSPYLYLSTVTDGSFFTMQKPDADAISRMTLNILLTWMHVEGLATQNDVLLGTAIKYKSSDGIDTISNENDRRPLKRFFAKSNQASFEASVNSNTERTSVTITTMPSIMLQRGPAIDLVARYKSDHVYRELVVAQLHDIISADVTAITVNPVFGTLWRTVCRDRKNEARNQLVTLFGSQVALIESDTQRAFLEAWLEESYDYAGEIEEALESLPKEKRFPAVYLDRNLKFTGCGQDLRRPTDFTRKELLEIARSCNPVILGRLGKVLTQLVFVQREQDVPDRSKAGPEQSALIPLALAEEEHGYKFWSFLLHTVLPGTQLAQRPAALLAALTLRLGIAPLRAVAESELLRYRDHWNTLEIPENWSIECLGLLLDADQDHRQRMESDTTQRKPHVSLLREADRSLFRTLVDYKMLELNLLTTLSARVGWTPDKSMVALGPVAVCSRCKFPRSVTVMTDEQICGLCARSCSCPVCTASGIQDINKWLLVNVSEAHDERTEVCWVECSRKACRAQYVVYHPKNLKGEAKCFYCRHEGEQSKGEAPTVQCSTCMNHIIWPKAHRPSGFDDSQFRCYACVSGISSVVMKETNAKLLAKENGTNWLVRNDERAIPTLFAGQSMFKTASGVDLDRFSRDVALFPTTGDRLTLSGKLVQNEQDVKANLRNWVVSRQVETGTCSLCFSEDKKANLHRACGRSGCHQLVCDGCRNSWYGMNRAGHIINVPALCCPFCRRLPAGKVIHKFDLVWLGGLRAAVEEASTWIYGWCVACGYARQYMERVCGTGEAPVEDQWKCEECIEKEAYEESAQEDVVCRNHRYRECPACGVMTSKLSGCDHISCPCGAHWCWSCGWQEPPDGEFPEGQGVYDHMYQKHYGIWNPGEEEDEWEDNQVE